MKRKHLNFYKFYKEEGVWKIDFTVLFPVSISYLKKIAESSGKNENDFLLSVIASISGKTPGPEIWKALQ